MESKLLNAIDESMPRFNTELIERFHLNQFESITRYYENSLKQVFKHLPAKGVRFSRIDEVSPKEYFNYLIMSSKNVCDVHKESVFPVKLIFEWKEPDGTWSEFNPIYQMLTYTNEYGDIFLRNTHYNLKFVFTDRGLPVTKEGSIFVKTISFKFKVTTEAFRYITVIKSGKHLINDTTDINISAHRFYSAKESRRIDAKSKIPRPLLSWYVFGVYGFSEAIKVFAGCEYRIGATDTITESYNSDDGWYVIKGSGGALFKLLGTVIDNDTAIAVRNLDRKDKQINMLGVQYVVALLYVSECLSTFFSIDEIDNPDYWRLIIGRCSVKGKDSDEYLLKLMNQHFESVSEYLDDETIKRFKRQGIHCNSMFELLNYITLHRSEIVQTTDRANMFGKELTSIEHTIDVLLNSANTFNHDIKNTSDLTRKKVEGLLPSKFGLKSIDNTQRSNMSIFMTPTDCPLTEHVLSVMPQDKVNPPRGGGNRNKFDPSDTANLIDASIPFVCSYLKVSETNPDGRGYLNPCIHLENGKVTALKPELKGLYEQTNKRLKVREPSNGDSKIK